MSLLAEHLPPTPPEPEQATNYEVLASYEAYRKLCDSETDGFRKVGIQDPNAYESAIADARTVLCKLGSTYYPVITPIDYEDRYQADRCKEMTGKDQVMLLTVPVNQIHRGVLQSGNLYGGQEFPLDFAVVVEEIERGRHENRTHEHTYTTSLVEGLGALEAGEFVHPLLEKYPENRTAWMAIFNFGIESKNSAQPVEYEGLTPESAIELAWAHYCNEKDILQIPGEDAEGTYLLTAQQLREHPEIVDRLWAISEVGFGKILGANHPMSMEVTREFFEQELMTEGIYTSIRYHKGQPVCFGSLALNMNNNDWLDCHSTVLEDDIKSAIAKDETIVHFYELISNGPQGVSFSPDVINLFLELAGRTGKSYHVFFESTNLSARYIPKIVSGCVEESKVVNFTQRVKMLSKLHYWYFATSTPEH